MAKNFNSIMKTVLSILMWTLMWMWSRNCDATIVRLPDNVTSADNDILMYEEVDEGRALMATAIYKEGNYDKTESKLKVVRQAEYTKSDRLNEINNNTVDRSDIKVDRQQTNSSMESNAINVKKTTIEKINDDANYVKPVIVAAIDTKRTRNTISENDLKNKAELLEEKLLYTTLQDLDMTGLLQQQLIHNFAIKHKHIPRVTLFTCRKSVDDDWVVGNINNNMAYNKRQAKSRINTMEILKRMYMSNGPSAAGMSGTSGSSGSSNIRNNSKNLSIGYSIEIGNNNGNVSGIGNAPTSNNGGIDVNAQTVAEAQVQVLPKGVLIKVVQIDQLINRHRNSVGFGFGVNIGGRNFLGSNNGWNGREGGGGGGDGSVASGISSGGGSDSTRNAFTNANWFETVLRTDNRRQIVVLDLSCGAASRRLIEMAGNKGFFNSTYHWLLIEDDAFNQNNENTANDNGNKNNNINNDNDNNKKNNVLQTKATTVTVDISSSHNDILQKNNIRKHINDTKGSTNGTTLNTASKTFVISSGGNARTVDTVDADENDIENIEKFLEKININIDTELILARRYRHSDRDDKYKTDDVYKDENGNIKDNYDSVDTFAYRLYDIWNSGFQYGGQLNISEIGTFILNKGFALDPWYKRTSTIIRRLDMKLARIRCMIVITNKNRTDNLEHYVNTHYDTHLDSMNRFNFALLSYVRDLYNFSFVLSKTASWGYLKNGKFDGMIGALVRKQADIGGSPIFFRIERAKVIDYTTRTWVARPCFIFRHPRSTKKDRIVFLQPFSNGVWVFVAICGIITVLLMWLLTTLESKLNPDHKIGCLSKGKVTVKRVNIPQEEVLVVGDSTVTERQQRGRVSVVRAVGILETATAVQNVTVDGRDIEKHLIRWGNICCTAQANNDTRQERAGLFFESLLFYIGSICQQGLAFSTRFFSGRCIIITCLLFSFSIYQFYSASIVGTLLMEKPKTIRTLRDLVHSSLEIGIEDIVYNRDYFLRTKDPDAMELYAKKVTSVPMNSEQGFLETPPDAILLTGTSTTALLDTEAVAAAKAKSYREILHSHETGAHAKTNEASNWYDPEYGIAKIKKGRFAFHVDVATAYKIISDTFNEKEICDLTEIQLFPPQKMVSIVQKGSPLRKIITYGLRRVTEVGLMDYQHKVWHSPKPRCVKQIHTDDLRVGMQTFTSAFLVLLFGYIVSLLTLGLEIMHHKLQLRFATA